MSKVPRQDSRENTAIQKKKRDTHDKIPCDPVEDLSEQEPRNFRNNQRQNPREPTKHFGLLFSRLVQRTLLNHPGLDNVEQSYKSVDAALVSGRYQTDRGKEKKKLTRGDEHGLESGQETVLNTSIIVLHLQERQTSNDTRTNDQTTSTQDVIG